MTVIDNLINGNLSDARKGAKRYSFSRLTDICMDEYGYGFARAVLTAGYLKGLLSFQEYADKTHQLESND
jgi:hypothetical protein